MKPNYFKLRLPNDIGRTINENGVLKIAYTATHGATLLPDDWKGNSIELYNMSASETVEVAHSQNPTAEVDITVAATTAGASTMVGQPIPPSTMIRKELEMSQPSSPLYLIHEGTGSGTLYAVRGS